MPKTLDPFRFLLVAVAGWMNQQQQHAIEYLREENRILLVQLGSRRLRLTDDQRRSLAAKARGWVICVPEQILIRRRTGDAAGVVDLPCQARLSDICETIRRGVRRNLVEQCVGIQYRNIDSVSCGERRKRRNGSRTI
jgi:hypothetical protein